MIKRALSIISLIGLLAAAGCHMGAGGSVRADYSGSYGGGGYVPYYPAYYDPFYDPFFYPGYYDPFYPRVFFGTSFFYGYPFYPRNFIIVDRGHRGIPPGARSLRGFRRGSSGGGTMSRTPSGSPPQQGSSGGGRSLR